MIKHLTLLLALIFLAGCSGGESRGPADTTAKMNPLANDADEQILNSDELPINAAYRYPTIAGYGVLWKPVSDNTGKLAVVLAVKYGKGPVDVFSASGKFIERGKFTGYGNPNRATIRFSKPGGGYGSPCYVRIGGKYIFKVPNSAKRWE